jgi:signal transduction histidine kinase
MNPLYVAHVVGFGLAGVACLVAVPRARDVEDPDTRRGLAAFLASTAAWALSHVGYLLAPGPTLKYAFYMVGLLVGFGTVFTWLYFCSAYAGRSFHRTRILRWAAAALFLAVVGVKVTNAFHGLYFEATMANDPFTHLAVQHGLFHLLTMGVAYSLSVLGFYLLFEAFAQVGQSVRPLLGLSALFVAPLAFDVVGATTDLLVEMTYEPLGVAAFALGVTVVYDTHFQTVQLAAEHDDPVLVLTDDGRIRDYNRPAAGAFPELACQDALGRPLDAVAPDLGQVLDEDTDILVVERDGVPRYYRVTTTRQGTSQLGRAVTLADVTEREQYRRKLERQNERLERFASVVSHDLRNPLTVAEGRIEMAREDHPDDESLEAAASALDRMETLIEDLLALARQGEDIDEAERVSLSAVAERCWANVESDGATVAVAGDLAFEADPDRLQQLLENLLRNAIEHGGSGVAIEVGAIDGTGFYVADDGPGVPEADRGDVFESGFTTATDGTGFGLAIVQEIARAHDWEVAATESESGGARFEITGVTPA